jgi:hypothetical protein
LGLHLDINLQNVSRLSSHPILWISPYLQHDQRLGSNERRQSVLHNRCQCSNNRTRLVVCQLNGEVWLSIHGNSSHLFPQPSLLMSTIIPLAHSQFFRFQQSRYYPVGHPSNFRLHQRTALWTTNYFFFFALSAVTICRLPLDFAYRHSSQTHLGSRRSLAVNRCLVHGSVQSLYFCTFVHVAGEFHENGFDL